jgi:cellulase
VCIAQFYPDCVQIEVMGDGDVELPEGVSFPGAYGYDDPGVVHNVGLCYCFLTSLFNVPFSSRYTAPPRPRNQRLARRLA